MENEGKEKIIIKKYPNRRLYDTKKSKYITLKELAEIIKDGYEIEVIDVKTGENVTAFILTQIILEETRKNSSFLPVSLLHLIIRYGENILSEFFDKYLELTIKNYLAYKSAVDEQFKNWLELSMDLSSMGQKAMLNLFPMKHPFDFFSKTSKQDKEKPEE